MAIKYVLPGDLIGKVTDFDNLPTDGYYILSDTVHASRCGTLKYAGKNDQKTFYVTNVVNEGDIIPSEGDLVEGRIKNIGIRYCKVEITKINNQVVKNVFNATLRKENIRKTEVDRIIISECYRPHDIIRAKVVSLGSMRSYELSTADEMYGVVHAKSYPMKENLIPVSWNEMKCPITGELEKRKVAKLL